MSLLKREAKASSAQDSSRRARLVEFVKSSGRKLEAILASVKWFDEILAMLKLLNDVPDGTIDASGLSPHFSPPSPPPPKKKKKPQILNTFCVLQMRSS